MIYLIAFFAATALIVSGSASRPLNMLSGLMALAFLCIAASIRLNTGTDFQTYVEIWDRTPTLTESVGASVIGGFLEPLFAVVNSVLKSISSSQLLFFSFYACLTLGTLHLAIRQTKGINHAYAYLLYFSIFYLPYTFNAMRQAVAMSIFLLAAPAIVQGRTRAVLLLSLLATGFHYSGALIGIGYAFLSLCRRWRWSPWQVFAISVAVGGGLAASELLSRLFFIAFPGAMEVYSEVFDAPSSVSNVLLRLGLCVMMLAYVDLGRGERRPVDALLTVYFLGLIVYLALFQFNMLATRFNMLFRVLEVLLLPMIALRLTIGRRLVFVSITLALAFATLWVTAAEPDYFYDYALAF